MFQISYKIYCQYFKINITVNITLLKYLQSIPFIFIKLFDFHSFLLLSNNQRGEVKKFLSLRIKVYVR
jgi:hypothetical protein